MIRRLAVLACWIWGMQFSAAQARDVGGYSERSGTGSFSDWGYSDTEGPENWSKLKPDYVACNSGTRQSPVDIASAQAAYLPSLSFQYRSSPLAMVHSGYSIRIQYDPGSFLRVGSERYELEYVDFHTPGEHSKNGVAPDMEIHLMHRNRAGTHAVVSIPVMAGRRHNGLLSRIWQHLPARPGEEYENSHIGIKPIFLLPSKRDYYTYQGSLTNPPCTEGVSWFVMRHAIEVPAKYVERFRQLLGNNRRPTQPLNGRQVLASQ